MRSKGGVTKGAEDEIVISGMSGRFPESDSLDELWNNLMSGEDMIKVDGLYFLFQFDLLLHFFFFKGCLKEVDDCKCLFLVNFIFSPEGRLFQDLSALTCKAYPRSFAMKTTFYRQEMAGGSLRSGHVWQAERHQQI